MSRIDYSALRPTIGNDRWSPLATVVYAITVLFLIVTVVIFGALISHFNLSGSVILLGGVILSSLCIMASRALFRRVNPARIDDLVAFAAMNNLTVRSQPVVNTLDSTVRILLNYDPLYPPRPWRYTIDFQLDGSYQTYPITLYTISLDPSITTDSPIEDDTTEAHYQQLERKASIVLTIHQSTNSATTLAARHRAVIVWQLPAISSKVLSKIQRLTSWHGIDAQTNDDQLALLLPSNLPYDRKGMMKLYQLLDRIHDITTE